MSDDERIKALEQSVAQVSELLHKQGANMLQLGKITHERFMQIEAVQRETLERLTLLAETVEKVTGMQREQIDVLIANVASLIE